MTALDFALWFTLRLWCGWWMLDFNSFDEVLWEVLEY